MQYCLRFQTEKTLQKGVDKRGWKCYNMRAVKRWAAERLCEEQRDETYRKKVEKTFEKPLDKCERVWYNSQALPLRVEEPRAGAKKYRKNFKKTFEKPLDKRLRMWYNSRAVQKAACERRLAASWGSRRSLTIEQQEIKVQAKLVRNLEISLKKEILNLSRIQDILEKV